MASTTKSVANSLVVLLILLVLLLILYTHYLQLSGPIRVINIINERVYIKSPYSKQPLAETLDEPSGGESKPWYGSSTTEIKRTHPFPFYEENVTGCSLPATGVKGVRDVAGTEMTYGRPWPLMQCRGHTSATENVCMVLAMQLKECERQHLLQIVNVFHELAQQRKWVYFMGNKMLLGSWRHHGLAPYERDLTIFVNSTQKADVLDHFSKIDTFITEKLGKYSLRITHNSSHINKPYLDIHFFQENSTHVFHTSSNDVEYVIEKRHVFPTHFRPFGPFELQAPKSSALILFDLYGDSEMCGKDHVKVPCSDLRDYVAFVFRRVAEYMGPIEERLGCGDLTYQFEFPREDINSVSVNPFTLRLPQR